MGFFSRFSTGSRLKKLELLKRHLLTTPELRILDLGAEMEEDNQLVQFLEWYPHPNRVIACNLDAQRLEIIREKLPRLRCLRANGMHLPFADKTFDVVYCNAVIEHVGTKQNQRRMAAEIMRVGKSWFVTTPNRWFPLESHIRLPLVHWLPQGAFHFMTRVCDYDHVQRRYTFRNPPRDDLCLLSARALSGLFPGSRIFSTRVASWPASLVAIGPGEKVG
jgi:hypothetical protein